MTIRWAERAQDDLAAVHAFLESTSPHYATVIVRRLLRAVDRLYSFPLSGRTVPEFSDHELREIIFAPYRIVYRVVSSDEVHMLTVHHAARGPLGQVEPTTE